MLDIEYIRKNQKLVEEGAKNKGRSVDLKRLLEVDAKRRDLIKKIDELRANLNQQSKIENQNDKLRIKENISELKNLKERIKQLEPELSKIEAEFKSMMFQIPNPPAADVKIGKNEADNEIIRKWGTPPKFDFQPLDHLELGKKLGIIDMERAAKVSGARFYYLKGKAVLLWLALVQLGMKKLVEKGFIPVLPPVMIGKKAMAGMGYLEHGGEKETYYFEKDNLYLVGTAEQSLGPMHMDEILNEKELPLKYAGYSTCFRREAGAYGKDTRGMFRLHQFDKVEMFVFCLPEDSAKIHQELLAIEEELIQELEIPYRVSKICTGELGDPAAKKFDIEAWMAGQDQYRETHSTSDTTDYQSRRLNIRVKRKTGQTEILHTLNGTAFSMRPLLCILENNQTKNGEVLVPKILQGYTKFAKI